MTTMPPGITLEMVEATTEAAIQRLKPDLPTLDVLINQETLELVDSDAPMPDKHLRMIAIVDQASALVGPQTPCKSGCSHCCKMAVTISSHEADLIAEHIGVERDHPPMALDQGHEVSKFMNVPCVFLKKGKCSIYEVRPLACRTHYNLSAFPEVCNTVDYPGNDVPNLDWRKVWNASAIIHAEAGASFADIRDFFPNGARNVQYL